MTKRLDSLKITEVSGVDHPAHLEEGWLLLKSTTSLSDTEIAELLAEAEEITQSATVSTPTTPERLNMPETIAPEAVTEEEIMKSLPEPIRKRLERLEEVEKAKDALTEEIRKERDARLDRDAIEKARDQYSNLPGVDPATFGPLLRKAAQAAPDEVAEIEKALGAADKVIAESVLLKEVGTSVRPGAGSDAYSQLSAIAKAAATTSGKTFEAEFDTAVQANPALYQRHLTEGR